MGQIGQIWMYQATAEDGESDTDIFSLGGSTPGMLQLDSETGLLALTTDAAEEFWIGRE